MLYNKKFYISGKIVKEKFIRTNIKFEYILEIKKYLSLLKIFILSIKRKKFLNILFIYYFIGNIYY